MSTRNTDTEKTFQLLNDTTEEFVQLVSSFNDEEINAISYAGSWTAAQVAGHVTLSNIDIIKQLSADGKKCEREPDAGVEKIRSIFLNFTKKLSSPDFILPTRNIYEREMVIKDLKQSVDQLKQVAEKENPFEIINHRIFGEITRFETLYFVIYHTQRHCHQLRKIQKFVFTKEKK
jgi:hypothetical protein